MWDTDNHGTIILHCHWREFWSRDTDLLYHQTYLLKIKKYQILIIIGANQSFSGSSGSGISLFSDNFFFILLLTFLHFFAKMNDEKCEKKRNFAKTSDFVKLYFVFFDECSQKFYIFLTPNFFAFLISQKMGNFRETIFSSRSRSTPEVLRFQPLPLLIFPLQSS